MNKILIGVIVAAALVVGVGAGYLVAKAIPVTQTSNVVIDTPNLDEDWTPFERRGRGSRSLGPGMMMPDFDRQFPQGRMGSGMFNKFNPGTTGLQLERISIDDAASAAQDYATRMGEGLRVAEVMEFEENFYAVVVESETGKGAFELLVDPFTSRVMQEFGPSRMWNTKFGHMNRFANAAAENKLDMQEALVLAQAALEESVPGGEVSAEGIEFYGYYSFDYEIDGKVAGMLSVNGNDGQVWLHNWHGGFIAEKEFENE